jgi:hypothetical protein
MSNQNFIKEQNISTLWDVIADEDIFKFLTRDNQINVFKLFNENIKGFFEAEKMKQTNLIDMNKKYILIILNYIRKNFPNNMPNKIKIYQDTETKEAITYEEIQNERKSQFEIDYIKRQDEFTKAMSIDVPKKPEFKDNFTDEPISEMEEMIKEITAKRNYDIEQVNRNYQQNNDQWLKPQETSIKNEKFILSSQNQPEIKDNQEQNKYKNQEQKNVSWGKNEVFLPQEQEEGNIFKKLKKISNTENTNHEYENQKKMEERLINIEKKLELYNDKIDKILNLLDK